MSYDLDEDNINAIKETFAEFGLADIDNITRFMTPAMKRSENPPKLYQVVFNPQASVDNLKQIKSIDEFRVRIEKLIGSKTAQCHKCQRFTHVSSSCHYKYRCVQCTTSHGPGNCPRISNDKLPIGCINCLDGGFRHNNHTANDLVHCTYYQKYFSEEAKQSKANNNNRVQNSVSSSGTNLTSKNNTEADKSMRSSSYPATSTSMDFHAQANGQNISKRKNKKLIRQFRPNVLSGKSTNSASVNNNNKTSNKLNIRDKKKLFELFEQFIDSHCSNR